MTIGTLPENIVLLENRMNTEDEMARATCTPFNLPSNESIKLEDGSNFPGNSGVIWEFCLRMTITRNEEEIIEYIPTIIIESENGFKLLVDRFVSGLPARLSYEIEMITRATLIKENYFVKFNDLITNIFSDPKNILEHLILRAGRWMRMSHLLGTDVTEDDLKRHPVDNVDNEEKKMYEATVKGKNIEWGNYLWQMFSDICPASGATNGCFGGKYLDANKAIVESHGIIYNCCLGTINAFRRCLPPLLIAGKKTFVMLSMGIFNVLRQDITLPNGVVINAGTIININDDPEDPQNKCFVSHAVYDFLKQYYPSDIMGDINGEVGEKTAGEDGEKTAGEDECNRDVAKYDLYELWTLMGHHIFSISLWYQKICNAFKQNPGLDIIIRKEAPALYHQLCDVGIIKKTLEEELKPRIFTEVF